ncbi:MAG: hypothetical protein JWR32_544 [Mycobacterium sp.]|nr:hypothetical protein [Mycobacterium sp.]
MVGDGGEGEVFGMPGRPEVAVVVDWVRSGDNSKDFAGDRPFE